MPDTAEGAVLTPGAVPPELRRTAGTGRRYPLVLDPAWHRRGRATPRRPFRFTPRNLFNPEDDPRRALAELNDWSSPFDLALTPTGFLTDDTTGIRALQEAIRLVEEVRPHRLILAIPLTSGWLTEFRARDLVSLLRPVRVPTALILDPERVPVDSAARARALRSIVAGCQGTGVLGTGLAALDAMSHGAGFASVDEVTAAATATPSPGEPFPPVPSTSPGILHRRLLTYLTGPTATAHLEGGLGRCDCEPCLRWGEDRGDGDIGRPYGAFGPEGGADPDAAYAHNLTIRSRLWHTLSRAPSPDARAKRWQRMCFDAVRAHGWHNGAADPKLPPLRPPEELLFWADWPGW